MRAHIFLNYYIFKSQCKMFLSRFKLFTHTRTHARTHARTHMIKLKKEEKR